MYEYLSYMITLNIKQKKELKNIAKKYDIDLFVLFGSYATGRVHLYSDMDIAYRTKKLLALEEESQLILDLSTVFQQGQIDLVNINAAPPLLRYAVCKDGILLYEKEPYNFASFSTFAFKQYVESKQLFIEQARRLKEHI